MINEGIRFSILVPVYNVEKYVGACIDSVLGQTYGDFELILVDDGSKDQSGKICDSYAISDPRLCVYHKPNGGLLHTRRYAIERATGDYYIFLDSDDSLKPNALEVIRDAICRTQSDCVIYGYDRVFEGKIFSSVADARERVITDKAELYREVFSCSEYNCMCRKAVKSTLFDGREYSAFFSVKMAEDLMQSIEIYENCQRVVFLPNVLYNYTLNPNSITQTNDPFKNSTSHYFLVRSKVLEFLQKENVFSAQDYRIYRTYCIDIFLNEILTECSGKISAKALRVRLKEFRKEPYYFTFLNSSDYEKSGKRWLLFTAFRYKWDVIFCRVIPGIYKIKQKRNEKKVKDTSGGGDV